MVHNNVEIQSYLVVLSLNGYISITSKRRNQLKAKWYDTVVKQTDSLNRTV